VLLTTYPLISLYTHNGDGTLQSYRKRSTKIQVVNGNGTTGVSYSALGDSVVEAIAKST